MASKIVTVTKTVSRHKSTVYSIKYRICSRGQFQKLKLKTLNTRNDNCILYKNLTIDISPYCTNFLNEFIFENIFNSSLSFNMIKVPERNRLNLINKPNCFINKTTTSFNNVLSFYYYYYYYYYYN